MYKYIRLTVFMLFMMLLTACNNAGSTELTEEETVVSYADKDTLVYDFKGQQVEVKVEKENIPDEYGMSISLPEGIEKVYRDGDYDEETGSTPVHIEGKNEFEGIRIRVEKEKIEANRSVQGMKQSIKMEMGIPITGEYPTVTEVYLDDYPELKNNFDFFFRGEASNLIYLFLGKEVSGELIILKGVIVPEADIAYESLLLEILKTYVPSEEVQEQIAKEPKAESGNLVYHFNGEKVEEKAKRLVLSEEGVASMLLPKEFEIEQFDQNAKIGTGKYEGIKINASSNPLFEGEDLQSLRESESGSYINRDDVSNYEEINLQKYPSLKDKYDYAFKVEYTGGWTQYSFNKIENDQIYTLFSTLHENVDKGYEAFLFEALGTMEIMEK